jgi:hypothetical protein
LAGEQPTLTKTAQGPQGEQALGYFGRPRPRITELPGNRRLVGFPEGQAPWGFADRTREFLSLASAQRHLRMIQLEMEVLEFRGALTKARRREGRLLERLAEWEARHG